MPPLETPPNPTLPPAGPEGAVPDESGVRLEIAAPLKVRAGRFGELEHHELLQLLDTIDDERSRSRFRESIYISVFVYLALAWFVLYGPRVLFHQGRIILPADAMRLHERELTTLNLPKDLAAAKLKSPKAAKSEPRPALDSKTLDRLKAMRRPTEAPPAARATPLPATPQPQPPVAQPAPAPVPTPLPAVRAAAPSAIPDAPKPNFSTPSTASDSMRDLAANAGRLRGSSGGKGLAGPVGRSGAGAGEGAEVLSDTMGVDFDPYIKRLLIMIRAAWIPLLPEETQPPLSKEGMTLIRFRIDPNGHLSYMHLDDSTQDQAIDKAAWASIKSLQGQYPPLPAEFKGPNLDLRIQFNITQDRRDGR